ncbi:MAG: ATP-binding protein, partial [Opitutales bacterium]|nr:ATP-binding protein [Opitutales bacterium]
MPSQYFIGREKELQMVEKHLLHRSSMRAHFQFALVWGPEGIGKSAFLNQFSNYLQEEGLPVLSFHIGGATSYDSGYAFFRDLIGSAKTNMGDMEPMIMAINSPERALNTDRGETVSVERHWADTLL